MGMYKRKKRLRLRVLLHNAQKTFRNRVKRQKLKVYKRALKWEQYRLNRVYRQQAKTIRSFKDTMDLFLPINIRYLLNCEQSILCFYARKT